MRKINAMKKLTVSSLVFVALICFAAEVNAQSSTDDFTGKIETKFDQGKNETELELTYIPVTTEKANMAILDVSISFTGKKLTIKPDDVIVVLAVVNKKDHKYPDINEVTLNSGANKLGQVVMLNLDQRKYSGTEILETMGTRMKMEIFHKLATSKQAVTFKIAESTFTIEPATLAYLADFEKATNP